MGDYVPANDVAFQLWISRVTTYVGANLAHFGLVAADLIPLSTAEPEFSAARVAFDEARNAAKVASADKQVKRATAEQLARQLIGRIQANPATTSQDREALEIPARGAGQMALDVEALPDRPSALIDIRGLLRHTLRVENQGESGTTKAMPEGATGAEVWVKVGTAPADVSEMRYVGLASPRPFVVTFLPEDGNKQAHYKMRWLYGKREAGQWGELETATIAA